LLVTWASCLPDWKTSEFAFSDFFCEQAAGAISIKMKKAVRINKSKLNKVANKTISGTFWKINSGAGYLSLLITVCRWRHG
jgi:hypothetical protein